MGFDSSVESPTDCQAVLSHVRSAHEYASARIEQDALVATERAAGRAVHDDLVAALLEARAGGLWHVALHEQAVAPVVDARGLTGLLHVHAEVDQVDEHLRVALRLVMPAHDA